MQNPYNRAKVKTHDRDLYDYKFPHTWSKRKKENTRLIRARLKEDTKKECFE